MCWPAPLCTLGPSPTCRRVAVACARARHQRRCSAQNPVLIPPARARLQVIREKGTHVSKGYGFVTFAHPVYATLAMQNMNHQASSAGTRGAAKRRVCARMHGRRPCALTRCRYCLAPTAASASRSLPHTSVCEARFSLLRPGKPCVYPATACGRPPPLNNTALSCCRLHCESAPETPCTPPTTPLAHGHAQRGPLGKHATPRATLLSALCCEQQLSLNLRAQDAAVGSAASAARPHRSTNRSACRAQPPLLAHQLITCRSEAAERRRAPPRPQAAHPSEGVPCPCTCPACPYRRQGVIKPSATCDALLQVCAGEALRLTRVCSPLLLCAHRLRSREGTARGRLLLQLAPRARSPGEVTEAETLRIPPATHSRPRRVAARRQGVPSARLVAQGYTSMTSQGIARCSCAI